VEARAVPDLIAAKSGAFGQEIPGRHCGMHDGIGPLLQDEEPGQFVISRMTSTGAIAPRAYRVKPGTHALIALQTMARTLVRQG